MTRGVDYRSGIKFIHVASELVVTPDAWNPATNTPLILWQDEDRPEQYWIPKQPVVLTNKSNGLQVTSIPMRYSNGLRTRPSIQQTNYTTAGARQWFIEPVSSSKLISQYNYRIDGLLGYSVLRDADGLVLAPAGTTVAQQIQAGVPLEAQVYNAGNDAQLWAQNFDAMGAFKLVNKLSGLVITPEAWSANNGNKLIQWHNENRAEQYWQACEPVKVININNGLALTPESNNYGILQRVLSPQTQGGLGQRWLFNSTGDGYYNIFNATSGRALTTHGYSSVAGTQIVQWDLQPKDSTQALAQQWRLEPAERRGYRIVNRVSGLAITANAWSPTPDTQLIAWGIVPENNAQVWDIPATAIAVRGGVPPEVIQSASRVSGKSAC